MSIKRLDHIDIGNMAVTLPSVIELWASFNDMLCEQNNCQDILTQ